ncbi:uncharacterized protein LOC113522754 [Galleria mellonella]|uniref:Uncharacterized protein LOC113522754 n=1 Tax=Galleria mellonella TaxID=7137 RepID=A0A6J1X4T2_GALME|nr:uncharacterized protein LOC113522754 [Galleria mellonella]
MKKVRFESPVKIFGNTTMNESECHSPRPFIEKRTNVTTVGFYNYPKLLPYSLDPLERFENSNSMPYPHIQKTPVENYKICEGQWSLPSNDLELSMLDASNHEPRKPCQYVPIATNNNDKRQSILPENMLKVLSSVENTNMKTSSNIINEDNSFFIKRGNVAKINHTNSLQKQFNRLSLDKENNPIARKMELIKPSLFNQIPFKDHVNNVCMKSFVDTTTTANTDVGHDCSCHHCIKISKNNMCSMQQQSHKIITNQCQTMRHSKTPQLCACIVQSYSPTRCTHCSHYVPLNQQVTYSCNSQENSRHTPLNMVNKKTWAIEKYECDNNAKSMEVEKPVNLKEKREPTVSDLFKIIKLQNEQLQLLQEKVDRFISMNKTPNSPIESCSSEHIALETVDCEQHKISIGVMTSFEMVRTSTVINKEVVKQKSENAQIQCNRSQISVKEVISKSQPVNQNFLEGIAPISKTVQVERDDLQYKNALNGLSEQGVEEKTLNDLSLHNIHVDNEITPLMSPEQSLYLDIRDYSDSDCGSNDQSNVGWTYYNKVMTHVNGMLQDSDMPSSASAMYRNTRQQCVQMQIDKTNVSVTKRVKFGDDPLVIHQPHIYATSTDTSLKMNQLAAKYLKGRAQPLASQQPIPVAKSTVPIDMSFATRNYMERHKLLQGTPDLPAKSPPVTDLPKFLDITALKQQPKLL